MKEKEISPKFGQESKGSLKHMEYQQWKQALDDDPDLGRLGDKPENYSIEHSLFAANGYIAIPVDIVSSALMPDSSLSLERIDDIEVLDHHKVRLGFLVLSAGLETIRPQDISDHRYAAYLTDIEDVAQFNGSAYRFRKSYMVLEVNHYQDYVAEFKDTAPIWGGFFHELPTPLLKPTYRKVINQITAVPNIVMDEPAHTERAARALIHPYAFERFVNQYHLLEMLYHYVLVQILRNGSLVDAAGTLKKFMDDKDKELPRLTFIIETRCKNPRNFEPHLKKINDDPYYKGKTTRIIIDELRDGEGIFKTYYNEHILVTKPSKPIDEKSLPKIVAICIYKIRNSIVHSKLGEYFLTTDDERFLVEIIEPLLQEVLKQAFT